MPKKPNLLIARAPTPHPKRPNEIIEKQKVILLRFKEIPKTAAIERAFIELTVPEDPVYLQGPATLAMSCNAIRNDWDAATATWNAAAAGNPWAGNELDAGGIFLSMTKPQSDVVERRRLRWDVTQAVSAAQKANRDSVSLLLRAD